MPPRAPRRQIVTDDDRVRVVVRIRPPAPGARVHYAYDESRASCDGALFDAVLGPTAGQEQLFMQVLPIVEMWLSGYNGTIFAYGQTASGKTFSMLGRDGGKYELDGVIPQVVTAALQRLSQERRDRAASATNVAWNARLQASYVELYNDALRDLIKNDDDPSSVDAGAPEIHEHNGEVVLTRATKVTIESPQELLRLIEIGSRRRAMNRTNMNLHSSRSHAVLSLYLECRWKDMETPAGAIHSSVSMLQLVDLAGSEYAKKTGNEGAALRESIHINTGLFELGNVIAALSGHRDRRVGNFVPYRNSKLTWMLKSALGGDARTALIVCVHPGADNYVESQSSLSYAASARRITNVSRQHVETVEEENTGPYSIPGDLPDPDERLDRRAVWVETDFGDIFCRVLGPLSGDVLLFIHGSGPTNSSAFWNSIVWEMACRAHGRNYCYVAMDCPGYGRSRGDRQHIRSSPGALINQVLFGLGKREALCLIGSSQGACAVFNAVLEYPRICRRITVIHPVGHDPARYTAIRQPTLLTFDTEDAGHPVAVGRIMRRNIPHTMYHEYKCSATPFWESEHTATEILKLIDWTPQGAAAPTTTSPASATSSAAASHRVVREAQSGTLWRLGGGIISWVESNGLGHECYDLCVLQKPSTFLAREIAAGGGASAGMAERAAIDPNDEIGMFSMTSSSTESSTLRTDTQGSQWEAHVDPATHRMFYMNIVTGETKHKRPKIGRIVNLAAAVDDDDDSQSQQQQAGGGAAAGAGGGAEPGNEIARFARNIFNDGESESDDGDAMPTEEDLANRATAEMREARCTSCSCPLWRPQRARDCRHVVCGWCFATKGEIQRCCPTCKRTPYDRTGDEMATAHQQELARLQPCIAHGVSVDAAIALRRSLPHITLEYGNTAAGSSGASFLVCASIKCVKVDRGNAKMAAASIGNVSPNSVISRIGFDINPSFPKSAVKINSPPFRLERDMSTAFTCAMQVSFSVQCLSWLTLIIPYGIHHVDNHRERVVVYVIPPKTAIDERLLAAQPHAADAGDGGGDAAGAGGGAAATAAAAAGAGVTPIALISQTQRRAAGRNALPQGWHRLPDIDYDECAVTECFIQLA